MYNSLRPLLHAKEHKKEPVSIVVSTGMGTIDGRILTVTSDYVSVQAQNSIVRHHVMLSHIVSVRETTS